MVMQEEKKQSSNISKELELTEYTTKTNEASSDEMEVQSSFFVDHSADEIPKIKGKASSSVIPKKHKSQIDILRKQLQDEANLEKPEYISVVVSSILLLIISFVVGFLYKVWWVALIFGLGSGAGVLLLWLIFTKLLTDHKNGFELSWFFATTITCSFSAWFLTSSFIGLLTLLVAMGSFTLFRLIFLEKQQTTWEELGLPQKIRQLLFALPEDLSDEAHLLLDNGLEEYALLYEFLEKEDKKERPLDKKTLQRDAERILINLFKQVLKISKIKEHKTSKDSEQKKEESLDNTQNYWKPMKEIVLGLHEMNNDLQSYFEENIEPDIFKEKQIHFHAFARKKYPSHFKN